jgi:signal transduction histidine kinase
MLDLAADLALRLAGATDREVDEVITEGLRVLAQAADADRAYVTAFSLDRTLRNSHEWTSAGALPHRAVIADLSVDQYPYSYGLACANEVLYAHTLEDLPPEAGAEYASFAAFGVKTWLEVPVMVDGQLLGAVGFNHTRSTYAWDDESIARVRLVARAIGVALIRRTANEHVQRSLAAAEQANRAREELYAQASHELRTPLHAVLGFAEILELDGVKHDALDQIQENGRLLLTMIDDLLELGRLATHHADVNGDEPLLDVVQRVADNLLPVAAAQHTELHFDDEPAIGTVVSNSLRWHQVIHCVNSAAILAAGAHGSIAISYLRHDQGDVVRFTCAGPNHRAPLGVGLALARSMAGSIGASVDVTTAPDSVVLDVSVNQPASP